MSPRMYGPTHQHHLAARASAAGKYPTRPDSKLGPGALTPAQRLKARASNADHPLRNAQAKSLAARRKRVPITLATVSLENKT